MDRAIMTREGEWTTTGVETGKLGVWLFLASEVMFFTGLIGGYIVLRLGSASWPDPGEILAVPVLAFNTFVLICSSVTMVLGLQAIQGGDAKRLTVFLLVTALLGLTFLVVKGLDYAHLVHNGFTLSSSLFGSCYYTLTGFHGLHVAGGVVALLVMAAGAARGKFSNRNYVRIEGVGLYWHFVDLVWIILFAILCLV
jgi:heme/copper-type cytochrome/quinol oxidase subunit 3